MTRFRIIASRCVKKEPEVGPVGPPEFDVEYLEGSLSQGDAFLLFETHHPCEFRVLEIRERESIVTLVVTGNIPWDNRWRGAIVDTDDPKAARRFGYSSGWE